VKDSRLLRVVAAVWLFVAGVTTGTAKTSYAAPAPSNDANLSALSLSSGSLAPVFAAATTSYTADLTERLDELTVTAVLSDAGASMAIASSAGDCTPTPMGPTATPVPPTPTPTPAIFDPFVSPSHGSVNTSTVLIIGPVGSGFTGATGVFVKGVKQSKGRPALSETSRPGPS